MVFVLEAISGKGADPVASVHAADWHAVWQAAKLVYASAEQISMDVTYMQNPSHICEGPVVTAVL